MLPAPITDPIVQKIAEAVWNRPELDRLREPIEAMLIYSAIPSTDKIWLFRLSGKDVDNIR